MTRGPVHVVTLLDRGNHRLSRSCECSPSSAYDMSEPAAAVVYVHGPMPTHGTHLSLQPARATTQASTRETLRSLFSQGSKP